MEFKDVMEWVDAMIQHNGIIVSDDNVKTKISYVSDEGETFSISPLDLKKTLKKYPPNREVIVLAEKTLSGDKESLADFVNESLEVEDEMERILTNNPEPFFSETPKERTIDGTVKTLLNFISDCSVTELESLKKDSIYVRLLCDVLNNDGPKGEWLKVLLNHLK